MDAEKAFDIIQHVFMLKILNKMGIEGMYQHIVKAIYDKLTNNIINNGKKFKTFPLRSRHDKGAPSHQYFSI